MAKRKTPKIIKIPGMNGQTMKIVQPETIDPNRAPLGSALSAPGAKDLAIAVADGLKQIFGAFGIRGFALTFVIPIVQWRKDIVMPDGTKSDGFVIVDGSPMGFAGFPATPDVSNATNAMVDLIWRDCHGLVRVKQEAPVVPVIVAPEASPSNLPDVPPGE